MSIGKALGKMWREEGFRGFMAGNGTNCIRIVPYSAVQFGSYNFYKRVRRRMTNCCDRVYTDKRVVLRGHARRTTWRLSASLLWCHCRNHFRHHHLPARYRPNTLVHPISFICWLRKGGSRQEVAGHVADTSEDVQDRRWLLCAVPRHCSDSCWCCAIRKMVPLSNK